MDQAGRAKADSGVANAGHPARLSPGNIALADVEAFIARWQGKEGGAERAERAERGANKRVEAVAHTRRAF